MVMKRYPHGLREIFFMSGPARGRWDPDMLIPHDWQRVDFGCSRTLPRCCG